MHELPVVFSGGGTGGHLYPALALAEALVARRPDVRPFFIGARRGIEARILPDTPYPHLLVDIRGLSRSRPWSNGGVLMQLFRAVRHARESFALRNPALTVLTGGYAAAPAGVAAVTKRVPLVLQEQNSYPGVTTRLLARWAKQVHLAYPEAARHLAKGARAHTINSANPVRSFERIPRAEARSRFGLPAEGTVVLVTGGSQGARGLNQVWLDTIAEVERGGLERPADLRVLWAAGPKNIDSVRSELAQRGSPRWVKLLGYIDDMEAALNAVDLAVSRAGAMTTSEYFMVGLPSILVPLPTSAEDHQTFNALALDEAGAAIHLPERGLTAPRLWDAVLGLATNPERRASMGRQAFARADRNAADTIAAAMEVLLPRPGGATR